MKSPTKSFIRLVIDWDIKQFAIGFFFGILICLVYNSAMYINATSIANQNSIEEYRTFVNNIILEESRIRLREREHITNDFKNVATISTPPTSRPDNICGYGNNGPRILCTVFTYKKNFNLKAQYVDKTWGKRCDKTIFMSGHLNETEKQAYSHMDIVYLNVTDTNRLNLTTKTIQTLLYANKNLINQFDWILKADDDTYVIMENLKEFLANKCPTDNTYYGFRYKPYKPDTFQHDFNSGGAGYVISNKVVRQFSENYVSNTKFCRNTTGSEDVDIAKCLKDMNVQVGDSRDEWGLERFHPLSYESMWNITPKNRTYHHARFPLKKKGDCCSGSSISFHYTTGQKALQLDYLLYKLRPSRAY